MDIAMVWAVAVAGAGGLTWLIRLEGRVNTNEALHKSLKDDVEYIRRRIDEALR